MIDKYSDGSESNGFGSPYWMKRCGRFFWNSSSKNLVTNKKCFFLNCFLTISLIYQVHRNLHRFPYQY